MQCSTTPPERSGIIRLKLKRKLEFRGNVYFQAVRPQLLQDALNWLKINNPLYSDIGVSNDNIDANATHLQQNEDITEHTLTPVDDADDNLPDCDTNPSDKQNSDKGKTNDDEEIEDPMNEYSSPTSETCLQSVIPDYPVTVQHNDNASSGNEVYNIAPGENKHPVAIMMDKQCEELAFPVLFPKGQFGYTVDRDVKLSPVKYFNARLLHYSGRFAMNPEYLFFCTVHFRNKESVRQHKYCSLLVRYDPNVHTLQNLICQDQAYLFLRQIRGTPPYWQTFMYEVVAMVLTLNGLNYSK